ncbi:conserved hypothetical protein [Burkholderiales bacterium]|nr:conserved hypothetical protein [Burkholderiales bacterium]
MNQPELPIVELRADELPAYCPNPSMPVWNHHPRVFLEVTAGNTTMCPYCGTRYRLAAGQALAGEGTSAGH